MPQHLRHHSHESTWRICQPKWHHQPFKQAIRGFKRCLPFISRSHSNLVIPLLKSILENNLAQDKQSNISSNLGIGNLYFTVILLIALLSTHSPRAILFGCKEGWDRTRTSARPKVPLSQQLFNLFLNLLHL